MQSNVAEGNYFVQHMFWMRPTVPNESKSNTDEHQWVIQIRQTLEEEREVEEEDDDGEFIVSIFNVPKPLLAFHPDSYIPQQVAIGPYHYWRPELIEMERTKLIATKRLQKNLQNSLKLHHLVDQLRKSEHKIRSCYHRYINLNGETLIWMMVIDASFLLEFLQFHALQEQDRPVHHHAGRRLDHNATLRDIVMLENQIPLFVLRRILEFKLSSQELSDNLLLSMFMGLFKEISPFQIMKKENHPEIQVSEIAHLLDFLYEMVVPKLDEQSDIVEFEDREGSGTKTCVNCVEQTLSEIWGTVSKLTEASMCLIKRIIVCMPWTIISNLPGVVIIKQPVEYLFFSLGKEKSREEIGDLASNNNNNLVNKPPLMEEITIPSVTELLNSGICFLPTNGGILCTRFDVEKSTLYLPTISLDMNSEVLLRNLVAYEASIAANGPLVFTRYTEFMNGIIDSEEDATILRENGIIMNHLKSDEEVASLWNGMSRSIKLTRVPFLDKVIEDVNKYYNGRLSVKVWRFLKIYVFASWQSLTFLVVIFILFLMSLQAFCSLYRCNSRNHVNSIR